MEHTKDKANTISDFESHEHPTPETGSDAKDKVETEKDSGAKPEEHQALQEKYLRLAAEFENYKRLAQRDQREFSRFANEQVLREMLPVIDNLERALQSAKDREQDPVIEGVKLTLKQFLETLMKFGAQPIASVGTAFDPARHQAVSRIERPDLAENVVVEEYQKGYLLHERVLRAAMVAVATGGPPPADPSQHNQETPHTASQPHGRPGAEA